MERCSASRFRIFWIGAPRWLYLPVYIALGWAAIFWLGDFADTAGPAVLTLIIVGGGLYSLGALIYGLKRPNPIPRWFGFHEVFHSFVIAAFAVHYVGVSMIIYGAAERREISPIRRGHRGRRR